MNTVRFNGVEIAPMKIVCVGRNYVEHSEELDNKVPEQAVIFVKQNSSISNEVRFLPQEIIHYEGEITFLIRSGKIAGVGFGLDLTKRDLQKNLQQDGLPWERAKSFNGSAIFSEFVGFDGELSSLNMELSINGELKQQGGYDLMLNKPEFLLEDIATFMTLQDNDLLMTGTPKGVGPIHQGDNISGRILQGDNILVEAGWTVRL